jgi:two-component system, OmpR family, response regulator
MRHPIRILVVDANSKDRDVLAHALRGVGYHTTGCATGAEAVRLAPILLPDLLMLEMTQGGRLVGPELARRLQTRRDQLLFFVTHDGRVDHRLAAFDVGADDYVVKPYVMDEVLARIRALLRRSGRATSLVTQVGDLIVDEPGHRATFGQVAIDLGPTDFALLAVLARHAGQVLSKARLLELVWGYDTIDENLVEVHVSILRRRLGQPAAALIQTVRGVGYVLRDDQQRTCG